MALYLGRVIRGFHHYILTLLLDRISREEIDLGVDDRFTIRVGEVPVSEESEMRPVHRDC